MDRRYTAYFLLLGIAQLGLAAVWGGLWALLLAWSGISFLAVGIAYAGIGARLFGKRPHGALSPLNALILAPYLLLTWLLWLIGARLRRSEAMHTIVPGLTLGRRVGSAAELPPGTTLIVDMTCEFAEPKGIRAGRAYRCFPTLDTCAPDTDSLRAAIDAITEHLEAGRGGVYLHCALGHGRSATVAAGVVIRRGLAATIPEAEAFVRTRRPGIKLHSTQRDALSRLLPEIRRSSV